MENSRQKLLIVDDNPKNLQVLGKTLEQQNYKVEFSINGESALKWISHQKFDLILLDIMMPGINGLEVCKKIRSDPEYNDVPIIFLSGNIDKKTILQGFDIGAQDYVTKPFDSRELLARVKTQLELRESRLRLKKMNQGLEIQVKERTFELERVNEELENANKELMNLDKTKNEFLNIIGHEVRTALNGILGPVALLKEEYKGNKLPNLIRILDYSVSRLEKFALTALTITELKTGVRKIEMREIDPRKLIPYVINNISDSLKSTKILVQIEPVPDGLMIKGDLKLLTVCLESILNNAVKYSPDGGIIRLNLYSKNNRTFCEVSDEGKGFSKEYFNNMFKLFMPGEQHLDQNIGLDLALVKLIMDAHSGNIEVENVEKGGATVRLIF